MTGKALALGGPIRIADYLSLGLLAQLVPPGLVDQALTEHGKHSQRQRDLPAHAVAYYVMALSLYRGINTEEVVRVGMRGFTEGCMIHGIFHGDLHGGNLMVLPNGNILGHGTDTRCLLSGTAPRQPGRLGSRSR